MQGKDRRGCIPEWHSSPRCQLYFPEGPGSHRAGTVEPCGWHAHTRPSLPSQQLQLITRYQIANGCRLERQCCSSIYLSKYEGRFLHMLFSMMP